jgi:hypothetical protein
VTTATAATLPRSLAVRQPSIRVVLGIGLALAGVAIVLWLHQTTQPRMVAVLQVVHDIPAGSVLRADDLVPVNEPVSDRIAASLVPASS